MVLPLDIRSAASEGDIAVVERWLDGQDREAINDRDEAGLSLLMLCMNSNIEAHHIQCARMITARGGDVNMGDSYGWKPLHYACYPEGYASAMVSLLLQAGANVNARTEHGNQTPLGVLLQEFDFCVDDEEEEISRASHQRLVSRSGLEILIVLLRAGASIDRCMRDFSTEAGDLSAEELMQDFLSSRPHYANDESFAKCREIVAGVRAHGSYKAFAREPHRQFLRLRSLLVRGRAEVRGRTKDSRRLERIARLPNGACWHVLSFWRDAG